MTDRSELKTDRLLLRPFRVEDVDDVFGYARHPEWTRYLPGIPQPYGRRHAEEFVAKSILASWESFTPFAIVLEGTVIGATNLSIDTVNETASLGYALAKEHWGKGLALEAAQAVVGWGFEERGLAKVWSTADLRNRRSWRVMEKLGMTREGLMRSHRAFQGERTDEVYYGILRDEWQGR